MGIAYLCMQLRIHHNDMKKHLILLCVLAFSASLHVVAQSIRKQIESHPELSANNYLAYPAPSGKLTPAISFMRSNIFARSKRFSGLIRLAF